MTIALVLALALAFVLRWILRRTVVGYQLRAVGDAPRTAERAGIDLAKMRFWTMTFSGAIAGFGGATIVLGVLHRFNLALSPGYGFIGIAVALVGELDPLWVTLAAFVFGILQNGAHRDASGSQRPTRRRHGNRRSHHPRPGRPAYHHAERS